MTAPLTAARLREVLSYDPLTGVFTRRASTSRAMAGTVAGSTSKANGHIEIGIDGRSYWASRLAWLYVNGEWPVARLGFRDGRPTNVTISNLFENTPRPLLMTLAEEDACARVRFLLDYDPLTGVLTSRADRLEWVAGQEVGSVSGRYLQVGLDGHQYLAHRLAWLHHFGTWPINVIDHKDGDGLHNAIKNLRDVTQAVNTQNQRHARSDNESGLIGAHYRPEDGRYASKIKTGGRLLRLGCFDTAAEAHAAYINAKRELHEGCTL